MKKILSLLIMLACACELPAQLDFAVSGTANSTGYGYTAGDPVTFTFTVTNANLAGYSFNSFTATDTKWQQETTAETPLFNLITGTGISGIFTQPGANPGDPLFYLDAMPTNAGHLTLEAGAEASGSNIGLVVGGQDVVSIIAGNLDWGQTFPAPQTYTSPVAYFTPYFGTHALTGGYMTIYLDDLTTVSFTANSLTIGAIPEPASAPLISGGIALALVCFLRRRRSRRPTPRTEV